jgi:hypothetical protein
VKPFVPSPSILAGNDTASDYEDDIEFEAEEHVGSAGDHVRLL